LLEGTAECKGYVTSINDVTINDENRLSKQVQELKEKNQDSEYVIKGKLQEKEDQIKKLQESVAFLSDKFNAFLTSQPGNKIIYHEDEVDGKNNVGMVKGIELKPEINNKAIGTVIPSSTTHNRQQKQS
jgi:hypothetical protein